MTDIYGADSPSSRLGWVDDNGDVWSDTAWPLGRVGYLSYDNTVWSQEGASTQQIGRIDNMGNLWLGSPFDSREVAHNSGDGVIRNLASGQVVGRYTGTPAHGAAGVIVLVLWPAPPERTASPSSLVPQVEPDPPAGPEHQHQHWRTVEAAAAAAAVAAAATKAPEISADELRQINEVDVALERGDARTAHTILIALAATHPGHAQYQESLQQLEAIMVRPLSDAIVERSTARLATQRQLAEATRLLEHDPAALSRCEGLLEELGQHAEAVSDLEAQLTTWIGDVASPHVRATLTAALDVLDTEASRETLDRTRARIGEYRALTTEYHRNQHLEEQLNRATNMQDSVARVQALLAKGETELRALQALGHATREQLELAQDTLQTLSRQLRDEIDAMNAGPDVCLDAEGLTESDARDLIATLVRQSSEMSDLLDGLVAKIDALLLNASSGAEE